MIDEEKLWNFPLRQDNAIAPTPNEISACAVLQDHSIQGPDPSKNKLIPVLKPVLTGSDRHRPVQAGIPYPRQGHCAWSRIPLVVLRRPMSHWLPTGSGDWRTQLGECPCNLIWHCLVNFRVNRYIHFTHSACALTRLYTY